MKTSNFMIRQPVTYVPSHVQSTIMEWVCGQRVRLMKETERETIQCALNHMRRNMPPEYSTWVKGLWPGIEAGVVSSFNDQFVFVKYHPSLHQTGWSITSQATSPDDLFTRSHIEEDRGHAMSPNWHWVLSGDPSFPKEYRVGTVEDGVPSQWSKGGLKYPDCRELVLEWAKPGDTYIELHNGQDPTELYLVVSEDHELGTVRLEARDGSDG